MHHGGTQSVCSSEIQINMLVLLIEVAFKSELLFIPVAQLPFVHFLESYEALTCPSNEVLNVSSN